MKKITILVDSDVYAKFQELVKKDDSSVSREIRLLMKQYIKEFHNE